VRVAHLILPSLAAFALASASAASANTGGGAASAGGASAAVPTSAGATTQPSFSGPTQGPGHCTATPSASGTSGGAGVGGVGSTSVTSAALPCPHPTVPGVTGRIINGLAYAPADAPLQVQEVIWAGDRIRFKPYIYAGGHGKWNDAGYDCSGTVSYVLHAAHLLKVSMDSSEFETWGQNGAGQWITVYTNPGHAFIEVAGIRLDTSAEQDPNPPPGTGPRWRPVVTSTAGFMARHPAGL
jgi:hypothetical protein